VDVAQVDDTVLVTNGVYSTGGRAVSGAMTNRVAVDRPLVVHSINGPGVTVIEGYQVPETTNGDGAVRCVYLTNGAVLSGFTLTKGATDSPGGNYYQEQSGGGVWCESSSALVTNCTLTGNSASIYGGGAYSGTLNNCTLTGNSAGNGGGAFAGTLINCALSVNSAIIGGGAYNGTLNNCTLTGNSASIYGGGAYSGTLNNCTLTGNLVTGLDGAGGGAYSGTLNNCTLTGNSAGNGGGASVGTLYNCTLTGNSASGGGGGASYGTLYNCILYYNTASTNANYNTNSLNYCCTTPLPPRGAGNVSADPQLASASHLSSGSPCRGAGSAAYATGVDIDGESWLSPPSIGCDEYRAGAVTGPLTVAIGASWTNVGIGLALDLTALIGGRVAASVWDFGDGTVLSNRPYASHSWAAVGEYPVVLRAYNESYPAGVSATVRILVGPSVLYVSAASTNPVAPYTSWDTAARTIQEAVDVSAPGVLVLVTNGVYGTGGRAVHGAMTNRVAVDRPVVVRSVNGPGVTVIQGCQVPGTTNGDGAVRCVYLANGAVLNAFTLSKGATRILGDYTQEQSGGGVWCESTNALVTNCTLTGNWASQYGGGACSGTLNNCALTGNSAGYGGGAYNGTLNNCTLTGNSADQGGGAYQSTLKNCILYYNIASSGANYSYGALRYCCTAPQTGGSGNISAEPRLASASHLSFGSPCRRAGSPAYATGVDIDGESWLSPPSIGCDEYRAGAVTGPLTVAIGASWTNVGIGFASDLTALIDGRVAASVWNFGDGTVLSNRPYASHSWAATGDYPVVLRAYNESYPGGVSATVTIRVVPPVLYVSAASANPVPPYTSWETAARTIQEAVDATVPGVLVLVTNGVYGTGGRAVYGTMTNRVAVDRPVVVRSVNGPGVTVIQGYQVPGTTNGDGAVRCVYLTNGAVLSGFTLTNGATRILGDYNQEGSGGGVRCESTNALITNCTLTGNSASQYGGGVSYGTLNNCTLSGNSAGYGGGGSFYGTLNNCTLTGNSASVEGGGAFDGGLNRSTLNNCTLTGNSAQDGGGASGGTLNNCALTGNSASLYGGGASGGTLNNCTLTSNSANQGGGAFSGTLWNCIVYYNAANDGPNYSGGNLNYCCTTPLPASGAGNLSAEPLFRDRLHGNLRLQLNSPCINAGLNDYAPGGADLDGQPRIVGGIVDIGAYEFSSGLAWASPGSILYGTPLSDTQLSATAEVAGTFTYAPPAGTVLNAGANTLRVVFTPMDAVDYNSATTSVSLVVSSAALSVTADNASRNYGQTNPVFSGTITGLQNNDNITATYSCAATPSSAPGPYAIVPRLVDTNSRLANYVVTTNAGTLTVLKATPVLTWTNPADIVYGTALGTGQLNASANVPGTFNYSPFSEGTILAAGSNQTLSVSFMPDDSGLYVGATRTVQINVLKATPVITWAKPAAITYPAPLGTNAQLNASANVAGTFVYAPAPGTVLNAGTGQILSVIFSPSVPANYNSATGSVTLDVLKAAPVLTWTNPADIVYGVALSTNTQLNAAASVPGTFAYTPTNGAVLNAGTNQLSVTFTPTDSTNYASANKTVFINVFKATPTLTWSTPAAITYGTALSALQLGASASIEGTFAYNPTNGTVLNAGTHSLSAQFTPRDTTNYNSTATNVLLTVLQSVPSLAWSNLADIVYLTPLGTNQLNANANVPGSFAYNLGAGTVLAAGTYTLSVTFTPIDTNNYTSASRNNPITVHKATPVITWVNPAPIVYPTPLGAAQLNASATNSAGNTVAGSFGYNPNNGTVLLPGNGQSLSVTFTPSDTANYNSASANVTIDVLKAPPYIAINSPTNGSVFTNPVNITITATATNLDHTIAQVTFFAGPLGQDLLGVVTNAPYSFLWTTSGAAPTSLLTAAAIDGQGVSSTSAPVAVIVQPGLPVFTVSSNAYAVLKNGTNVIVTVLKSLNSQAGTVNYSTSDGSALAGTDGSGSYQAVSGSFIFAAGETSKTVTIQINDDPVYTGDLAFNFRLSISSGGSLGFPSSALISIKETNLPNDPSSSVLTDGFPGTVAGHSGSLTAVTLPSEAGGQWRLTWEGTWHDSGVSITGLPTGSYPLEFSPRQGFYQPDNITLQVTNGLLAVTTNSYYGGGSAAPGILSINLLPSMIANAVDANSRGQWQLQGENSWHDSGTSIENVAAGNQIVQFKSIAGWIAPAPMLVVVAPGQTASLTVTYVNGGTPGPNTVSLIQISESDATRVVPTTPPQVFPYSFNGQLLSQAGYGSGCLVKKRVVLTAGHVVFNDSTMSFVPGVNWFFERLVGVYEPPAQTARGWYVLSGYAAQRTNDLPGTSAPASQNLDVAALYFLQDAGRGGFSGYLVSDATNEWLQASAYKTLVGYPVTTANGLTPGWMYATVPSSQISFSQLGTNRVFSTTNILGYPGMSGGPLCVQYTNGTYYPAGIYLGGSGDARVREIDGEVAALINAADITSYTGTNNDSSGAAPFPSVSVGGLGSQLINGFNGYDASGVPTTSALGGNVRYYLLKLVNSGDLVIDTLGSTTTTLLQVFRGTSIWDLQTVAQDTSSAPDGVHSQVEFPAVGGVSYLIGVKALSNPSGNFNINWRLGLPPYGGVAVVNTNVAAGSSLVLASTVTNGSPAPAYQWRLNGTNLAGATSSTYPLSNIQPSQAGTYSIVASNLVGAVATNVAVVTVFVPVPLTLSVTLEPSGHPVQYRLMSSSTQAVALQASTNLRNWVAIISNQNAPLNYVSSLATNPPSRFFRLMRLQ
jgi:MBG domain (YGX type)/Calx-beta domain/PKD domain